MGSSGSKAARNAGGAVKRQYPTRQPTQTTQAASTRNPPPPPAAAANVHPRTQASGSRSRAIDLDARDPDFAASLRRLGPVQPNPTYSPSSTSTHGNSVTAQSASGPSIPAARPNPALQILAQRERIAQVAERERIDSGKVGFQGRSLIDVGLVRKCLVLRDEGGVSASEIEKKLGLKAGLVASLGKVGVVEAA